MEVWRRTGVPCRELTSGGGSRKGGRPGFLENELVEFSRVHGRGASKRDAFRGARFVGFTDTFFVFFKNTEYSFCFYDK
jgi:hypothetical protein